MYNKLRGKIVELYGDQTRFSEHIGRSRVSVNLKLTGRSGFSQEDIVEWARELGIKPAQYGDYFFDN